MDIQFKSRSFLFYCIGLLLISIAVSCSKGYESPLSGKNVGDLIFESDPGSKSISFGSSHMSKLNISSSAGWCRPSITEDAVVINVIENDTYDERKAKITIVDSEDGSVLEFNVIQKQKNAILTEKAQYEIPEKGGQIIIAVQSNIDYSIEIPAECNWLKQVSGTRSLSESSITLSATKNNSGEKRETNVKLINGKTNTTNTIKVTQLFTPYIYIEKDKYRLTELGGEIDINIKTNVRNYTIEKDSWIELGEKIEVEEDNYIQKIIIPAFNTTGIMGRWQRNSKVNFIAQASGQKASQYVEIELIQGLYIDELLLYELYCGDTYDLKLVNETGSPVIWSSSDNSKATVDSKGLVTVHQTGEVTITVKTTDGKHSDYITIMIRDVSYYITGSCELSYIKHWDNIGGVGHYYEGYVLAISLKNKSNRNITLRNFKVYRDGVQYYDSGSDDDNVSANSEYKTYIYNIDVTNHHTYYCVFEYSYKNKTYSTRTY